MLNFDYNEAGPHVSSCLNKWKNMRELEGNYAEF